MINDKLMLNDDKTEVLVIRMSKQPSKVSVCSILELHVTSSFSKIQT